MKVAVLAGGLSTERDVSLITGSEVCKALKAKGHKAVLIDIFFGIEGDISDIFEREQDIDAIRGSIGTIDPDTQKVKESRGGNPDCLLGPNVIEICRMADVTYMGLHGAEGENGKVQATFDVLGIKYTGSGYLGSALAMDKGLAKNLLKGAGIPTPEGYVVRKGEQGNAKLPFPLVVKPCCGGSSVGVSMVKSEDEYKIALEKAFTYEEEVLVEVCITGREFSVGVIDGRSVPIIEIIPKEGFYDYETKYQPGMAEDICPAELTKEETKKMQQAAEDVYKVLRLDAYARIDFLMDKEGNMYCLEANTLPGMTPTSLLPQEVKVEGMEYGELCEKIIEVSLNKYK